MSSDTEATRSRPRIHRYVVGACDVFLGTAVFVAAAAPFLVWTHGAEVDVRDVLTECTMLLGGLAGYAFVRKLRLPWLSLGWSLIVVGLIVDVMDEFTAGSTLDGVLEVGQAAVQVGGFLLTAVGLMTSYRALESRLRRAREARSEARRSQAAFEAIFQEAPVGFWEADVEGTILRANRAAHEVLGLTDGVLIGTNPAGLVAEGASFPAAAAVGDDASQHQLGLWHSNGSVRTFSVHQKPIVDPAGVLTGTRTAMVDVTSKIALEQERARLEAQVRHRQKLETIGTLAGGIAHDFNNLLAPILGYVEIAIEELPEDSPIGQDLQQVSEAASRAKELVQQILTFSRQSEGERRATRVQDVVREVSGLLRHSVPSTVELHMELDDDCPPVLADPTRLHQVVMNLCSNAVHAMRAAGGLLSLELRTVRVGRELGAKLPGLTPGPHVLLTMADTGHGIDPAHLRRIFDPFFTTKQAGEGTGLGLSVVHGIVTAYGGEIVAESEPGCGTTFRIYLPVAAGEASEDVERASEGEQPAPGRGRILVVDDDDGVRGLTVRVLERLGYEVAAYASPEAALRAYTGAPGRFDVVLTDQTMPGMTGLRLAEAVRALRADQPIVLATGFSEAVTEESAAAAGVGRVLLKPYGKVELGEAVREAMAAGDARVAR